MWHLVTTIQPNQYRKKTTQAEHKYWKFGSFVRIESQKIMDPTSHERSVTLEQFFSEIRVLRKDQHDNQTFVVSFVLLGVFSHLWMHHDPLWSKWLPRGKDGEVGQPTGRQLSLDDSLLRKKKVYVFNKTLSQDSSETGLLLNNLSEPHNPVLG